MAASTKSWNQRKRKKTGKKKIIFFITTSYLRVAKGLSDAFRDAWKPKICSMTGDGALVSRVTWDQTPQRDAWFGILQARDAWDI